MAGTSSNARLKQWVSDWAAILQPKDIYWCDGTADEYDRLCNELVAAGTFTKLDEAKRPNSY
ncbi:MAG: phosphoenolpyruvate carboxykinase, partial [Actinomycetota bacterium]